VWTSFSGARSRKTDVMRVRRTAGLVLIVAGLLGLVWSVVVWRWEDPFTALYTHRQQRHLARQYADMTKHWRPPAKLASAGADARAEVEAEAAAYRQETHTGEAIGRIVIGRIGLNMILVDGTDHESLKRGPGRYDGSYMPGENRLVYIAGHRTTYLAPFAHIDDITPGTYVRIELPYATFIYRAFRHEIVPATALWVLRSPQHELLRLQACHPRFFATHRYIVDARLVTVRLRDGRQYSASSG
jgi:sortase A